jgi:GNAT superfamily N-acetyltransferase
MVDAAFDVRFALLGDVPHLADTLVAWYEREWFEYYGPGGPGDARANVQECMDATDLPVCLVAMASDGTPMGAVTLRERSFSHQELTPWVGALLVEPSHRRKGVGAALVGAAEDEARRRRFQTLHMATDSAHSIAKLRGWRAFDTAESGHGPVTVYDIGL